MEIIMGGFRITSEVSQPQDASQLPPKELLTNLTNEFPELATGLRSLLGTEIEDD